MNKDIVELLAALTVLRRFGNGRTRLDKLGSLYSPVQTVVNSWGNPETKSNYWDRRRAETQAKRALIRLGLFSMTSVWEKGWLKPKLQESDAAYLSPGFRVQDVFRDIQSCAVRALDQGRAVKLEADTLIEECMLALNPDKKYRQALALRTFNARTLSDSLKSHAGRLAEIAGKLDGLVSSAAQIVTCEMQDDREGDDD